MAEITARGRLLAQKLRTIDAGTCSLIARAARTYSRLAEEECNGPPGVEHMDGKRIERWQNRLEKRQQQIERRILAHVKALGEGYGVVFSGDPRGATVKITTPDKRSDDWGQVGICADV